MSATMKQAILFSVLKQYYEDVCGVGVIKVVYRNQLSNEPHKSILVDHRCPLYCILNSITLILSPPKSSHKMSTSTT